ncbi:hypothetical protein MBLNU457_4079t1 [Dothideomycetes sp. NU457]
MSATQSQYYPPPPQDDHSSSPPPQQTYYAPPESFSKGEQRVYSSPPQQQQYYPPPPSSTDNSYAHEPVSTLPPQHHYPSPPPQSSTPRSLPNYPGPPQPVQDHLPTPPIPSTADPKAEDTNVTSPNALVSGAPPVTHFVPAGSQIDDVGTFNGGSFRISHRDSNTILTLQLAIGCPLNIKPGTMISMSPTITLVGSVKFSVKKLVAGANLNQTTITGPGEILLAPHTLGDVTVLRLNGNEGDRVWRVGKDAFLACTQGVVKDHKSQTLGKAFFSGEGLWTYTMSGFGLLQPGEKYILNNGHLVAWNAKYVVERVASGGIISNIAAAEGLVCKFTGPGTVFMQTRNPAHFAQWSAGILAQS